MILSKKISLLFVFGVTILSCNVLKTADKKTQTSTTQTSQTKSATTFLDSVPPVYRASATRINDIIHTKLDVSFNWEKQYMYGKATIKIKPYFYPTSTLMLNARGMEIKEITLVDTSSTKKPLVYSYANDTITITLDRTYKNTEEYTVFIEYIAKPNELTKSGGSAAIVDDKGLYFINPDGKDGDKPKQIWTQGETQSSSVWFPTIDSPNERMTHEIYITVDKKYTTLSNGELSFSIDNGDSTRTDCWKMNLPHAPYLVMMAIGEYAIVKDKWRGREVNYYVEKAYEPYAKAIFGNTPEMMEFFSKKLGVDFPWNKYSQIVARDYVSGAMENTTAALFGEFLQRTDRELLDRNYEAVVSHELFHEWFGDFVTCESWSNIPLNESFATYGEYLWEEYKYGRDAADFHSEKSRMGYLAESGGKQVPMIRFYYNDKEDMFDGHSYNKGGQILHMLRKYVGDDAFFASLKFYMETNKFSSVEIHNLRLAFEQVAGEDLNWFFNQWFMFSGHPDIVITSTYNETTKKQKVEIKQIQNLLKTPLFKIPLAIDIYEKGKKQRHNVVLSKATETFEFDAASKPDLVNVDADKMLLCEKQEQKSIVEWVFQYNNAPLYLDRKEALNGLLLTPKDSLANQVVINALHDKMWSIRTFVISELSNVEKGNEQKIKKILVDLATGDSVAAVRDAAIDYLSENYTDKDLLSVYSYTLNDKSYAVLGSSIVAITKIDSVQGTAMCKKYENEKNNDILINIAQAYSQYGTAANADFYENTLSKIKGSAKAKFIKQYGAFLKKINDDKILSTALGSLKQVAEKDKLNRGASASAKKVVEELQTRLTK